MSVSMVIPLSVRGNTITHVNPPLRIAEKCK